MIFRKTPGAEIKTLAEDSWRLSLPPGKAGKYRVSQIDDYANLPRKEFLWQKPLRFSLQSRVSDQQIPGTWGFGFWNDPFSFNIGIQGSGRRLPVLPDAVWFFFASPENHLSFENKKPAQGMLASVFASKTISPPLLVPGGVFLPLAFFPPAGRLIRKFMSRLIQYDAARIEMNLTDWHTYTIEFSREDIRYSIDEKFFFKTTCQPKGKMGFLIWIDNQYASFDPQGKIKFGTLASQREHWLEIRDLVLG